VTEEEPDKYVSSNELLARFIFYKSYLRQDLSVRPDAFIPHPWPDLSVTRHLSLSDTEIWKIGQAVQPSKPLLGRADFQAVIAQQLNLRVVADPVPGNPNHANIKDWPIGKPRQKSIAQEIAATVGKALKAPVDLA